MVSLISLSVFRGLPYDIGGKTSPRLWLLMHSSPREEQKTFASRRPRSFVDGELLETVSWICAKLGIPFSSFLSPFMIYSSHSARKKSRRLWWESNISVMWVAPGGVAFTAYSLIKCSFPLRLDGVFPSCFWIFSRVMHWKDGVSLQREPEEKEQYAQNAATNFGQE